MIKRRRRARYLGCSSTASGVWNLDTSLLSRNERLTCAPLVALRIALEGA